MFSPTPGRPRSVPQVCLPRWHRCPEDSALPRDARLPERPTRERRKAAARFRQFWQRPGTLCHSCGVKPRNSFSRAGKVTMKRQGDCRTCGNRPFRRSITEDASLTTTQVAGHAAPDFTFYDVQRQAAHLSGSRRGDQRLAQGPPDQSFESLRGFECCKTFAWTVWFGLVPPPAPRIGLEGVLDCSP